MRREWIGSAMLIIRRVCLLTVCCLVCILFSSCGRKAEPDQPDMDDIMFYRPMGSNQPLHYFDAATRTGGVFCFDPTCEHKRLVESATGGLAEQGCPAYDYSGTAVFLSGDHLYFFCERCLWQADRQGYNRKIITRLSKPYEGTEAFFTDEAMYISYIFTYEYSPVENENGEPEWRVGELREKPEAGLVRIPYSGEGEELIYCTDEYYEGMVAPVRYRDGRLYFAVYGMDRPSIFVDVVNDPDWKEKVAEERRHTYVAAYEYTVSTGEIKQLFAPRPNTKSYFFSNTFGFLDDSGTLELYRYNGEKTVESEIAFSVIHPSSYDIVGRDKDNHVVMVSEETGKVMKRSPLAWQDFNLDKVIGESCYGTTSVGGNGYTAYISAEDFWKGNKDGILILPGQMENE